MGDSNAWDMVAEKRNERKKSRSPSYASRMDSEMMTSLETAELEALGLGKEELEEAAREQRKQKKRSKSPAMETIRKTSVSLLRKIGALPMKKDDSVLLYRTKDIADFPLDQFCVRPREFFQEPKPFFFRDLGRPQMTRIDVKNEKCSYLFRGSSQEEDVAVLIHPTELGRVPEYDHYCPVHGSRRRLARRNKLMTMQTLMSSMEENEENNENLAYIYGHEIIAKLIRNKKRELLSYAERQKMFKVMRKITSNLWIISVAFLFLFTAFNGLQNLQTSVNHELGSDSLIVFYVSLAISSLFVPTFMIGRLGCKLTFVVAIFIYILYIIVNMRPKYYSMIPASILCGIAASCVWAAKCTYITEMGIKYASLNFESQSTVIVRFFGYFFMIVHCGQVAGNIISSMVLQAAIKQPKIYDMEYVTCGHLFPRNVSELTEISAENLSRPPQSAIVAVCLMYLACTIVSVMIVMMFLNALHKDIIARNFAPKFDTEIITLMARNLKNVKAVLLIPLTIFNGIEQAFIVGVFTKAFVGCGLGIAQIGFVMASFGISDAICSLVFGPLIKLFGRMPLFVFGAVVNLLMIITLLIWPLNPADKALFYVIAAVWGMADGVWNTQINGFWVALVGRQSLQFAFTTYRFWESMGIAIGFAMLRFLTVEVFLLVSFFTLLIGMCGYVAIEMFDSFEAFIFQWKDALKRKKEERKELDSSVLTNQTTLTI